VIWVAAESLRSGGPRMRLVLHVHRHLPQYAPRGSEDTYTQSSRPIRYGMEIAPVRLRSRSNLILVLNGAQAIFRPVLAILVLRYVAEGYFDRASSGDSGGTGKSSQR
jgi:hypothetical protein